MNLKIITHERIVFEGEVDELVLQTTGGQIGILKDHVPLTTALDIGVTKEFLKKEWQRAMEGTVTPNCRMQCSGCGAARFGGGVCYEGKN